MAWTKEVKLTEESVRKAYDGGCEDVKATLKALFPDVFEKSIIPSSKMEVVIKNNPCGNFFVIRPIGGGTYAEVVSANRCRVEDGFTWVPFPASQMRIAKGKNFEIIKRR